MADARRGRADGSTVRLGGCEKGPTAAVCCGFQVSRSIRVCGFDSVPSGQSPVGWRDDRGPKRPAVRPAGGLRAMARRPDRRRTAAIRRVNLQGLGPSTPIKLANSNTSAEPECLQNAAMSAFFTGDYPVLGAAAGIRLREGGACCRTEGAEDVALATPAVVELPP